AVVEKCIALRLAEIEAKLIAKKAKKQTKK
ncbi:MAG: hypothetical protein RLZZ510_344, partial [Bacteroidota bacterium]